MHSLKYIQKTLISITVYFAKKTENKFTLPVQPHSSSYLYFCIGHIKTLCSQNSAWIAIFFLNETKGHPRCGHCTKICTKTLLFLRNKSICQSRYFYLRSDWFHFEISQNWRNVRIANWTLWIRSLVLAFVTNVVSWITYVYLAYHKLGTVFAF